MKKLKTKVVQKGLVNFFKILDLSSSNTREKYLLKIKCLHFFSLQATAVDRCALHTLDYRVVVGYEINVAFGIFSEINKRSIEYP